MRVRETVTLKFCVLHNLPNLGVHKKYIYFFFSFLDCRKLGRSVHIRYSKHLTNVYLDCFSILNSNFHTHLIISYNYKTRKKKKWIIIRIEQDNPKNNEKLNPTKEALRVYNLRSFTRILQNPHQILIIGTHNQIRIFPHSVRSKQ